MTTYRIESGPTGDGTQVIRAQRDTTIVLVGCGGTGGFLAEAIARLLIGSRAQLFLVSFSAPL